MSVQLLGATTERREPPCNITQYDSHLFYHEYQKEIEPCVAISIANLDILGPTWIQLPSIIPVDKYQPWMGRKYRIRERLTALKSLFDHPRLIDQALWVHDNWSGGYFHWLTDVCPKLLAWKSVRNDLLPVLLPKELAELSFVTTTLDIFGFPYFFFDPCDRLFVRRLWVIGPTAPTGNYRTSLLKEVSKQVSNRLTDTSSSFFQTKLGSYYISRKDASRRFLSNESMILEILNSYSIRPIVLAGFSIADQVNMFANCSLLVSIHGNGLTNMLWMPTGSSIIEIRRAGDSSNNCYFSMASALGHAYYYVQAAAIGDIDDTQFANLEVDPALLDFAIKQALV